MTQAEINYKRDTGNSSKIGFECTRYRTYLLNVEISITETFDDDEGIIEFYTPEYVEWLENRLEEKTKQKLQYEKMYNEANEELIKADLRKSAIRNDYRG